MRLPPDGYFIPRRGAALKGVGIWRWHGDRLFFSRPPRRVPTPRSPAEAFNRSQLYWSTQVVKLMDAYQRDTSTWLARNTQLAAQDFMYICLFGRLGHMVRRDGKVIYSMAAMQDVSKTIDAIWQLKGGILVRGETWWEGLAPGSAGQVLTMSSSDEMGWETPAPPPGSILQSQPVFTSFAASSDAFATQGTVYSIGKALTISKLTAYMAPASGQLYKAIVGTCSVAAGLYTITSISASPITAADLSGPDTWTEFPLSSPVTFAPGDFGFTCIVRTNGTTTNPVPLGQGHSLAQNAPLPGRAWKAVQLASVNPVIGNTFGNRADIARGIMVQWSE